MANGRDASRAETLAVAAQSGLGVMVDGMSAVIRECEESCATCAAWRACMHVGVGSFKLSTTLRGWRPAAASGEEEEDEEEEGEEE